MSKTEHTPPPWVWINANHKENRLGRLFGNGELVLDADPGIFGKPEDGLFLINAVNNHDNMIEALEWVAYHWCNQDMNHDTFRVKAAYIAEDALAKANGETP